MPILSRRKRIDPRAERRRDARAPCALQVITHLGGKARETRCLDLSCGGARIAYEMDRYPPRANPLHTLEIDFGGGRVLRTLAMTVWRARWQYGVRFMLTSAVDRLTIAEQIDRLLAKAA